MNDITARETKILDAIENLRDDIEAIQQNRSDFQIKHFVVGQHMTPGRQRMQCILELQVKLFNIRDMQLDAEKLNIEIDILEKKKTGDKRLHRIDIEKKKLQLAQIELSRLSQVREAETLYAIAQSLPRYTHEEYQAEEEQYWNIRLSTQANHDLQATGRIGQGNLEALRQIGHLPQLEATNAR